MQGSSDLMGANEGDKENRAGVTPIFLLSLFSPVPSIPWNSPAQASNGGSNS
jgi:hypothetical protein